MAYRDDDDDGDDDDAWDSEDGEDEAEDEETVTCPGCGREMYDDSPRCPSCGRYVSAEDFASGGKPVWVVVTAAVCLAVVAWWLFRGG